MCCTYVVCMSYDAFVYVYLCIVCMYCMMFFEAVRHSLTRACSRSKISRTTRARLDSAAAAAMERVCSPLSSRKREAVEFEYTMQIRASRVAIGEPRFVGDGDWMKWGGILFRERADESLC